MDNQLKALLEDIILMAARHSMYEQQVISRAYRQTRKLQSKVIYEWPRDAHGKFLPHAGFPKGLKDWMCYNYYLTERWITRYKYNKTTKTFIPVHNQGFTYE